VTEPIPRGASHRHRGPTAVWSVGNDPRRRTTPTPASTPSPSPTATADNSLLVSCPGFTPTVEIVNDTPYVILAAPCTPTPKP